MSITKVEINGREYPIAPIEPERWSHPSPAYPVAITPTVARSWLRYNFRNRSVREGGKRDYSADMRDGNFALNGGTISWTRPHPKGEDENVPANAVVLLDGQHRLESCVTSGVPFVCYVAYGLDPAVRHTIDTGIKRTFGDVLALRGESHTLVLASVVRKTYLWTTGDQHLNAKRKGTTHTQLSDFLADHPELRRSTEVAMRTHHDFDHTTGHPLRQSVLGLTHWLFMQVDDTRAPEFFARLGDGAEMPSHHPIMKLRTRLIRDLLVKKQSRGETRKTIQQIPDWQQLCYYIRTWNACIVWESLPESKKSDFTFSFLGPQDEQRIPQIKTVKETQKEMREAEEAEKDQKQSA